MAKKPSIDFHLPPHLNAQREAEMTAQQQMFHMRNAIAEQLFLRSMPDHLNAVFNRPEAPDEATAKRRMMTTAANAQELTGYCVAAAEGFMMGIGVIKPVEKEKHDA